MRTLACLAPRPPLSCVLGRCRQTKKKKEQTKRRRQEWASGDGRMDRGTGIVEPANASVSLCARDGYDSLFRGSFHLPSLFLCVFFFSKRNISTRTANEKPFRALFSPSLPLGSDDAHAKRTKQKGPHGITKVTNKESALQMSFLLLYVGTTPWNKE